MVFQENLTRPVNMFSYWVLYFLVLSVTLSCSVVYLRSFQAQRNFLILAVALILIFFSGLRGEGVDADLINYISWFYGISRASFDYISLAKDPAFVVLSILSHQLGFGIQLVLFSFALVAVTTKILYFKLSDSFKYWHIAVYLYFCRFYFVQDMTQIRAGAAIGLATLAFILIYKKRNLFGVCLFAISLFFHLSVVVLVPVVVAVYLGRDFISRYPIFIIIILSFFLNAYLDYFFIISGLYSHLRLVDYIGGAFETVELSLFSFYFIIKILLLGYLIFFQWSNLTRFWRLVVYIGVISSCFQLAFSQYDSLALRLAEVFALFDVQLFMAPLFIEKLGRHFRSLYLSFLIVLGAVFFISSLNIMNPYQMTELF
ncbi:MAG: EpsG family protein [Dethiobacter sp.]|nr:EpsG family protein [Dethiobacter sp.]